LLGSDPPDDVVVAGEPVGELQGQLGLAHPTKPMDRPGLGHHHARLGPQLCPQRLKRVTAAGEVRIARRQVGDRRTLGGKSWLPLSPATTALLPWEARRPLGPPPASLDTFQQPGARGLSTQPYQVDVDPGGQQPRQPAVLDAHRQQPPRMLGVVQERPGPLVGGIGRGQVGLRQQRDGAVGLLQRLTHPLDEVVAWGKVPGLQHGGVAVVLQLPGDPLRPGPVAAGVGDEEVLLLVARPCHCPSPCARLTNRSLDRTARAVPPAQCAGRLSRDKALYAPECRNDTRRPRPVPLEKAPGGLGACGRGCCDR
jgi:hypothetical protein